MPAAERHRTASTRRRSPAVRRVRTAVVGLLAGTLALTACGDTASDDASRVARTTTAIAGASIIGLVRDTSTACALPSPVDGEVRDPHAVVHTEGTSVVPVDARRIVVTDVAALDAVCALGLWERVVGAPDERPDYLGTGIREIPSVGASGAPSPDAVRGTAPDLILSSSLDDGVFDDLEAVAPTVVTGSDPVYWRQQFERAGEALSRRHAASEVLDRYREAAVDTGRELDSAQTEASIVRFTGNGITLEGTASFAGQVLADAGVRRPASQRFGVEDGATGRPLDEDDLGEADADLVYVVFDGPSAVDHGRDVMKSDAWLDLGAVEDARQFAMDDAVWTTPGPTAARAVLEDLRPTLNGYSSG